MYSMATDYIWSSETVCTLNRFCSAFRLQDMSTISPRVATDLLCCMTGDEWLARNAQQATDTYQKTAAARRVAATSAETVSSESAGPRQKLAGQLLQQQLQLLTVDSQEVDSALLTKLLRTCLVTVGLMPILMDGDRSAEDLVIGAANPQLHVITVHKDSSGVEGFVTGMTTVASLYLAPPNRLCPAGSCTKRISCLKYTCVGMHGNLLPQRSHASSHSAANTSPLAQLV